MARGPRKRPRSPQEIRKIREDEQASRDATPSDRQRKVIIEFGVAVLLVAFLTTSGITFVNLNSSSGKTTTAQNTTSPQEAELERWRKEAQEKPNDPNAQANLAFYLIEKAGSVGNNTSPQAQQYYSEANSSLQAALKLDKDYTFAIRLLGQMNVAQDKYDEAAKYYKQALESASKPVDPKDKDADSKTQNQKAEMVEAHLGLAIVGIAQKHPDDAFKQFDDAVKIDAGFPRIYMLRSQAYLQQGQKELARKDLETLENIAKHTGNSQMAQMAEIRLYMLDSSSPPSAPEGTSTPKPAGSSTPIQILPPPISGPGPAGSATPIQILPPPISGPGPIETASPAAASATPGPAASPSPTSSATP